MMLSSNTVKEGAGGGEECGAIMVVLLHCWVGAIEDDCVAVVAAPGEVITSEGLREAAGEVVEATREGREAVVALGFKRKSLVDVLWEAIDGEREGNAVVPTGPR